MFVLGEFVYVVKGRSTHTHTQGGFARGLNPRKCGNTTAGKEWNQCSRAGSAGLFSVYMLVYLMAATTCFLL